MVVICEKKEEAREADVFKKQPLGASTYEEAYFNASQYALTQLHPPGWTHQIVSYLLSFFEVF